MTADRDQVRELEAAFEKTRRRVASLLRPSVAVPPHVRAAALDALEFGIRVLVLPPTLLKFFTPQPGDDRGGYYDVAGDTVWIASTTPEWAVAEVVFHELSHAADRLHNRSLMLMEGVASETAARLVREYAARRIP